MIDWLLRLIDRENRAQHSRYVVRRVANCWDKTLKDVLATKLQEPTLTPAFMGQLAEDLLTRGAPVEKFAESVIRTPIGSDTAVRERTKAMAIALLKSSHNAGWPIVWWLIRSKRAVARDVFLKLAYDEFRGFPLVGRINEEQAADLYIWLARQFPMAEDPQSDGFHSVGAREAVAHFRDDLFNQIKDRGTFDAIEAIRRIAETLPDTWWMKHAVVEAETIALKDSWLPADPRQIRLLATSRDVRLVESESQLLYVVIESLERYSQKLQAETPANFRLWNEQPGGSWRPKEENRVSDELKLHLQDDLSTRGIVANREVEIRPGQGATPGEIPDIHVVAILRSSRVGAHQQVRVIIEVKGCWHDDVLDAMRSQLRDRYLRDNDCQHGLYVVGWFLCNQWDSGDRRRASARRLMPSNVIEAQNQFDQQSQDLSCDGMTLRALVVDASLRSPVEGRMAKKKATKKKATKKKAATPKNPLT